MTTTENNVAAQAGDEAMQAVVALAWKWHDAAVADGFAASEPAQELFELLGWPDRGAQVSPRATADVERDKAVCDLVRLWDSESVSADDYNEEMCRIEAIIRTTTTKPGA